MNAGVSAKGMPTERLCLANFKLNCDAAKIFSSWLSEEAELAATAGGRARATSHGGCDGTMRRRPGTLAYGGSL
jgi:hypothetical protein